MNFIDSGVTFKDILNAGLVTGGLKVSSGKYRTDANNNISVNAKVINAIDIDWNKAEIPGIDDPITSTGQLLAIIGNVKKALGNITPSGSGSGSGSTDNKSIIERLTLLETAVQTLQENQGGNNIPDDLVQQLDSITSTLTTVRSNINSISSNQQSMNTRLTSAESSITNLNKFKHIIIEKEEYDQLTSYEPNTLYFIIGEPDYIINGGGNSGGDSGNQRINLDSISTNLTINGFPYKDSEIVLQPGGTYNISGTLRGHIIIDTTGKTKTEMQGDEDQGIPAIGNTEIVLNNVIINTGSDNYGIYYKTPEQNQGYQDLIVTIPKNTASVIYCPTERPLADDQWGAIHSSNNLVVRGTGYIALNNKGGHGIRGTEVEICGPHIYNDVSHDGIHGKRVNFNYGYLYTLFANDAIGSGNNGNINVYGGSFNTIDLLNNETTTGMLFDSKNPGLYSNTISITGINRMNNMLVLNPVNYATVYSSTSPGYVVAYSSKSDYNNNRSPVTINGSTKNGITKYFIDESVGTYIAISGIINNPIEIKYTNATEDSECTIILNNAYITTDQNTPAVYYNNKEGRIKLISSKDCVNIIMNTNGTGDFDRNMLSSETSTYEGDSIKSENNIGLEIKNNSHLVISSKFADGIDGGYVKLNDSKGYLLITNCGQRGLKGNAIVIGPNAEIGESVISYYYEKPNDEQEKDKYRTFDGIAIIKGNCVYTGESAGTADNKAIGFADIYARNGKHKKGVFGTRHKELNGMIILGSIGAVVQIDMNNATGISYNRIVTPNITLTNIPQSANENDFAKNIYKESIN